MADELDAKEERKRLKEERKALKTEQKAQKKEAKARAKEIERQENELIDEGDDSGGFSVLLVTLVIVAIWVAILCLLIKLDVGGFGSNVLYPVLKDVPVINSILPRPTAEYQYDEDERPVDEIDEYGGYSDLREAVNYIRVLEAELADAREAGTVDQAEVEELRAEIERLRTFEDSQVEFQRIKDAFYEEVIYSDKGPGPEEYKKYYEGMDPETAEELYRQVIGQVAQDNQMKQYVEAYSSMKPKQAAAIFDTMTDDLDLVARILMAMDSDSRGKILGAMDQDVAAKVTKLMDPEY